MNAVRHRGPGTTAWVRLELDLGSFDEAPHRWTLERAAADGVVLTTMAALGDGDDAHRALWRLNRACAADMPERGEFPSFEEYAADRLAVASYEPDGVVVALDGAQWVGLCATSLREDDDDGTGAYAFNEMTGVLAGYRRRGLAVAMKLHAIAFARARGHHRMRTFHHPQNRAALRMNKGLGFTKPPGS